MKPETVSVFISLFQNAFFGIGLAAAIFYLGILDTHIGELMFKDWLIFVIKINSTIIWIMAVLSGLAGINRYKKIKKGVEEIHNNED